jgi:polysaccharide pyruvyl transferase WcaK-like protein
VKIGILTIKGFNCGSYLQAFALKNFVKLHHPTATVSILDTTTVIRVIKGLIDGRYVPLQTIFRYIDLWKSISTSIKKSYDVIIIGSDVVWSEQVFLLPLKKYTEKYFNIGLNASKVITYAVCCTNTVKKDLTYHQQWGIYRLDVCSVRDIHTKKLVKDITGKNPAHVLDPTFLIDWTQHEVPINFKDYILLYIYNNDKNTSRQMAIVVKELSRKTGKKILQIMGHRLSWADEYYPATPLEFLSFMKNASYVITNTFHGTVFSIIYKKKFISFPEQHKVENILSQLGIEPYKMCTDYKEVDKKLSRKIKKSQKFLLDALRK